MSPPGAQASPSQTYPEAFKAQLVLTVLTNRTLIQGNADRHDEFVSRCRVLMLQAQGAFNRALDHLLVRDITALGVPPEVRAEADLDVSPLLFALDFAVRPDAWPLALTGVGA